MESFEKESEHFVSFALCNISLCTNDIIKEIKKGKALNAFKNNSLNDWLREQNPNEANFQRAVRNFTRSCVAYSVATYILGIINIYNTMNAASFEKSGKQIFFFFNKSIGK